MFEKEAEEYAKQNNPAEYGVRATHFTVLNSFKDGAEFGYNKANEEAMMKLKDEGIVKPLKDSIFRNERLSSQEQQELCAWIECAIDFGENLDECAEKLDYAKTIIRDLLSNSDEYARQRAMDFLKGE
jgi:hypothetical protein